MFCPKCGLQNVDASKFCRGCGADLSNVLAVVAGKVPADLPLAEKQIDLYSRGLRGLIGGFGFLIVSGVAFGISVPLAVLGVFALAFAFVFRGTSPRRIWVTPTLLAIWTSNLKKLDLPLFLFDIVLLANSTYNLFN